MNVFTSFDDLVRLLVAAALGAGIGLEREIHGHPAGMRTHLLVALGSSLFTVLSIHGFGSGDPRLTDPSRVAAQVVSGIGFLGAGAILKEGASIRGLTTAASLWAAAAVGMAAGVGDHLVALGATVIVLLSLSPLNAVAKRFESRGKHRSYVHVELSRLESLGDVSRLLAGNGHEIVGVQTERLGKRNYAVDFEIRSSGRRRDAGLAALLNQFDGVSRVDTGVTDQ